VHRLKKSHIFPPNEIIFEYSYILMSSMTYDIDFVETLCVLPIFDKDMQIRLILTNKSFEDFLF